MIKSLLQKNALSFFCTRPSKDHVHANQRCEEHLQTILLLEAILDNTSALVACLDSQFNFIRVNPAYAQADGHSPDFFPGKNHFDLYPHPENEAIFNKVLETGCPYNVQAKPFKYENSPERGTTYWDWTLIPIKDKAENVIILVFTLTNVTERIMAEKALKEAKKAAEAFNHAKSVFLANISHELRSPLNAILGFAQIIENSPHLPLEHKEHVKIIGQSGENLLSLITQIIDLSKIEAGQLKLNLQEFDLYYLLDDLEEKFRIYSEDKQLRLIFDKDSSLPQHVRGDETKLRQILTHLLNNALTNMQTGEIMVRFFLSLQKKSPPETINSPVHIGVEIKDTGSGINAEKAACFFDESSFILSKNKTQDIGLAVSREFIRLMSGDAAVSSQLEGGTVFAFDIWLEKIETECIPKNFNELSKSSYRILIVDDMAVNRLLLKSLLKPEGFELREALNGREAVNIWKEWQPHLICLDMRMPVMDGYEAVRQIRQQEPPEIHTTVIALTASVLEEKRDAVLAAGCDDFLIKPFQKKDLFKIMERYLNINLKNISAAPKCTCTPKKAGIIAPEALSALPKKIAENLKQAIILLNPQMIEQAIYSVYPHNLPLAENLQHLACNFEYDRILKLIEQSETFG